MDINKEKEYIYNMMKDITQERRQLTDIYFELKKSLDELIKLEQRGLEDLSIKGYVELTNAKKVATAISNIKRETNHTVTKLEESLIPEEKTIIPKVEIELEKDKLPKRTSRISVDRVMGSIAHVLKEKGIPMNVKDLFEEVYDDIDGGITISNFRNNILPRSMAKNTRIQNVTRGFYQYV